MGSMSDPISDAKNDAPGSDGKLKRKDYERELERLHVEFVKLQQWVVHKGLRVCILFEGRDGAGKGGTIKAMTERVSPRIFRVVALPAPTEREKSQMYAQRYIPHLPAAGEIVIFDRSWYNRAGVERVLGFCTEEQAKHFLQMIPGVEKAIVDDGYSRARDEMFLASDTAWAPWYVAHSDDKRRARLNILTHILSKIPYEASPREKVELPKRQHRGDYKDPNYPFRLIPEAF
jgi:polyphosphate kinase 2 (PPK2 family)